ncbi:protein CLT2, chloroplastic-like [Chenopodium quinoa]|uniref:protein CLT2, chloroplastic-like n=1 Tax=Chenopodium quinoa TaxID=63459 RepID=UPI000B78F532|nr:protein CLT2, chloroplastic-like [Chenopodium quinoa]
MALSLHFFHHPKLSSISSSTPPKNSLSLSSITPSSTKMPTFSLLRNHHLLRNRPPIKPPFSPSFSNTQFKFRVNASSSKPVSSSSSKSSSTKSIVFWAIVTAILAVSNRVFYKLALVPLQNYPFFLAQFITFGYVAIYFAILFIRHRAGIVTDEMLAIPKSRFVLIGLLEALGLAGGMASAAMIPGPVIPILHQTFLVWQLCLSYIILGRRYSFMQIVGCLLVAAGVVVAVSSGSDGHRILSGIAFAWPALMIASGAFHAAASILKEFIFVDAATRLKEKSLDIFVVNSFGSGCQALFVLVLLPLLSNLKGIPFDQLPQYLKSGAGCFLNIGANNTGCDGAPLLPLLYVVSNIAFNISVLNLLKISSAVVSSLVTMLSVPISIYILSLPLPYLPESSSLGSYFVLGSAILMLGLVCYNLPQYFSKALDKNGES